MAKHRKRTFSIGRAPQPRPAGIRIPREVIHAAQAAFDELTPLILDKEMRPVEALILIGLRMAGSSEEHGFTLEEIRMMVILLLTFWEHGYVTPLQNYPYTLEASQAAFADEESEVGV